MAVAVPKTPQRLLGKKTQGGREKSQTLFTASSQSNVTGERKRIGSNYQLCSRASAAACGRFRSGSPPPALASGLPALALALCWSRWRRPEALCLASVRAASAREKVQAAPPRGRHPRRPGDPSPSAPDPLKGGVDPHRGGEASAVLELLRHRRRLVSICAGKTRGAGGSSANHIGVSSTPGRAPVRARTQHGHAPVCRNAAILEKAVVRSRGRKRRQRHSPSTSEESSTARSCCRPCQLRMDSNDGSQGGYQGGWNQYGYQDQPPRYQVPPPWFQQGMLQNLPNISIMHPGIIGPQGFYPAEIGSESMQPDAEDTEEGLISPAQGRTRKRTSAGARTKQSNFSPDEDVNLVKSYLEIINDEIIANAQRREQMWLRILERYNLCWECP